MPSPQKIVGIVLAGGKSTRMGTDKSLVTLGGLPLIERTTRRLALQVDQCAISANGNAARFAWLHIPVLADPIAQRGPLGGLLAGLRWAANVGASHLLTVACDTPFFPHDLAQKLSTAIEDEPSTVAVARSQGRPHYLFSLHPSGSGEALKRWLSSSPTFAVRGWIAASSSRYVDFDSEPDPFFNINTPDDLAVSSERLNRDT